MADDSREIDTAMAGAVPYWQRQNIPEQSVRPARLAGGEPQEEPLSMGPIAGGRRGTSGGGSSITPSVGVAVVRYNEGAGEYTLQTILIPAEWLA